MKNLKVCKTDKCQREVLAKGLCKICYEKDRLPARHKSRSAGLRNVYKGNFTLLYDERKGIWVLPGNQKQVTTRKAAIKYAQSGGELMR